MKFINFPLPELFTSLPCEYLLEFWLSNSKKKIYTKDGSNRDLGVNPRIIDHKKENLQQILDLTLE